MNTHLHTLLGACACISTQRKAPLLMEVFLFRNVSVNKSFAFISEVRLMGSTIIKTKVVNDNFFAQLHINISTPKCSVDVHYTGHTQLTIELSIHEITSFCMIVSNVLCLLHQTTSCAPLFC